MPPPRIINKMIIPNEIKVMTQQIIPQIIPAMVRPFPSGFIWPASILARSLLPIIQAGMPVKNQQRTKLRMPNIRISMPRWGSIALVTGPREDKSCAHSLLTPEFLLRPSEV